MLCWPAQPLQSNQELPNAGKSSTKYSLAIKNTVEKGNMFLLTSDRISCVLNSTFLPHPLMGDRQGQPYPCRTIFCVTIPCLQMPPFPSAGCCYIGLVFLSCSESMFWSQNNQYWQCFYIKCSRCKQLKTSNKWTLDLKGPSRAFLLFLTSIMYLSFRLLSIQWCIKTSQLFY